MPILTETPAAIQNIVPSDDFQQNFNRLPFLFNHNLANHPLFTLPRLLELAKETQRTHKEDLYYDAGQDVAIGTRWDAMGPPPPLEDALERIENNGAWISLHQAQRDPEYAVLFDQCMSEFADLTGLDFKKVMRVQDALIFITSPNRVTTYHIDRECNFLLQLKGSKTIHLFDQKDREVLPEQEIERFWAVDNNAPIYKPDLQHKATSLRLVPGNGVHIPVNAPHWLRNDDNISVSLSVNFTWHDSERANVYRANHLMRKLLKRFDFQPLPPFRSPLHDTAKNAVMAVTYNPARSAKRMLDRLRGRPVRAR
jgi:hypothetical protein